MYSEQVQKELNLQGKFHVEQFFIPSSVRHHQIRHSVYVVPHFLARFHTALSDLEKQGSGCFSSEYPFNLQSVSITMLDW